VTPPGPWSKRLQTLQQHIPQDELTKGLAEIKPPPK
jgi:hypothetical protein